MIKGEDRLFGGRLGAYLNSFDGREITLEEVSLKIAKMRYCIVSKKVFLQENCPDDAEIFCIHNRERDRAWGIFGSFRDAVPGWKPSRLSERHGDWYHGRTDSSLEFDPHMNEQIQYRRKMPWDYDAQEILQKMKVLEIVKEDKIKKELINDIKALHHRNLHYENMDVSTIG